MRNGRNIDFIGFQRDMKEFGALLERLEKNLSMAMHEKYGKERILNKSRRNLKKYGLESN